MAGEEDDRTPKHKRGEKPGPEAAKTHGPATEQPPPTGEPRRSRKATESAETAEKAPCPIVGVGASAGGLEALQGLFANLPSEPPEVEVVRRANDSRGPRQSGPASKCLFFRAIWHDNPDDGPSTLDAADRRPAAEQLHAFANAQESEAGGLLEVRGVEPASPIGDPQAHVPAHAAQADAGLLDTGVADHIG